MSHPHHFALQQSDLNPFLFAEVGAEPSGMILTVLSLIARLGEDPWQEARRLATLPKALATSQLGQIIARTPGSSWETAEATAIAARLTSLLPTSGAEGGEHTSPSSSPSLSSDRQNQLVRYGLLVAFLIVNAFLLTSAHEGTAAVPPHRTTNFLTGSQSDTPQPPSKAQSANSILVPKPSPKGG